VEGLRVSIGHEEVHSRHPGGNHAVHGVSAATPHTNYPDFGARAKLIGKVYPKAVVGFFNLHFDSPLGVLTYSPFHYRVGCSAIKAMGIS
jgi:hypothetical protein